MRTFWKPVYFEGYYETNLLNQKFAQRQRDFAPITKLPDSTRKPQGVLVSYLRPYDNKDPSDYVKFDKYYSMGEYREQQDIAQIEALIKQKTTKDLYNARQ